jgi:hypothetical protein
MYYEIMTVNEIVIFFSFLSPSLSGPTHLLRLVVQTDVTFYFMPGAQQA